MHTIPMKVEVSEIIVDLTGVQPVARIKGRAITANPKLKSTSVSLVSVHLQKSVFEPFIKQMHAVFEDGCAKQAEDELKGSKE